ncbi:MAG: hypothetical protein AB1482_03185 [Pseudomonadota bacterium]
MNSPSPFLPELPAHHYGVHVENEMDARRLRYLVEQVGAAKVEGSAARYSEKYPGSRIFVSVLLKRYGVRVPARLFAPVNVPIYRVYVLVHAPSRKLKIGVSGDWTRRAFRFTSDDSLDGFDLDRSIGIHFGSDKKTALAAETMAKDFFHKANANTTPPDCVPFGAYGHTEWFNAEIYADAVAAIAAFNTPGKRDSMRLREALAADLRGEDMAFDSERPHQ